MASIVTLTLNPALDVDTTTKEVRPTSKLRCGPARYDAGGGGINVARVAHTLGETACAVYPAGGPVGNALQEILAGAGIGTRCINIEGATREGITVNETSTGKQYRFVLPGPELATTEQEECLAAVAEECVRAEFVVASGSLPPGVETGFYSRVVAVARDAGARVILDTSGDALRDASGVFLVKPNLGELARLTGRSLEDEKGRAAAARSLIESGRAENVVISLGAEGAMLVTADDVAVLPPIDVPIRSAVGAGDTMVAGITVGLSRGWEMVRAVQLGVAAASATLITEGTGLCRRADVDRLFGEYAG
ncbi:1-phosphofructokinase family hexose kinase [Hoyosella altamirensis]|uniref:6-phosphofructokinase 2 n=1 Tax=Hoyosella altamirensis TaxID=616997 RepID=A0A839RKU6_9ACTN|nr:1-phosphofructokinase family hexose kinase [Hoyosella altamirensis]MBB3036736.1 6-phosphofructokinase 2 [Hoyosella altamirensis]